jgi:outer membrane protein assembly factor BamB
LAPGPDGNLYAASTNVFRINPDTGASQLVGPLPTGFSSSGDIAFVNGAMYVSTNGPCGGALVEFDLAKGTGKVLGGDGLGCVYGLALASGTLFILNCDGKAGVFNPQTGQATVLSTSNVQAYGADTLP